MHSKMATKHLSDVYQFEITDFIFPGNWTKITSKKIKNFCLINTN